MVSETESRGAPEGPESDLDWLARAAFDAEQGRGEPASLGAEGDLLAPFLQLYWRDRKTGNVRALKEYLELFPGDEQALAREFLALEGRPASDPGPSGGDASAITYGPYRVLDELGHGGQGTVYLAEDTRLHRKVALKVLSGVATTSTDVVRRFQREAEIASRLDHPGICPVYDAGLEQGEPYIAMRYVEGETMATRIAAVRAGRTSSSWASGLATEVGPESEKAPSEPSTQVSGATTRADVLAIVALFEKAARALHVAHEAGVIHRDVKPGNIMVTPAGDPILLDFGLARDLEGESPSLTRSGALFGTPSYMSPEQLLAHRVRLDRRTDVYSLGVSLYESLTLQRPFDAPTRQTLYHDIETKDPRDARKLNRAIPRDLQVVIATCLQKDRDRRYQTAADLADDLNAIRDGRPVGAKPVPLLTRAGLWTRREPAKATLLAVSLLFFGLAGFLAARWPEIQRAADQSRRDRAERLLEEAYLHLGEQNGAAAQPLLAKAWRLAPGAPETLYGLARAHTLQGRRDSAADLLLEHQDLVRRHPALTLLLRTNLKRSGRGELPDYVTQSFESSNEVATTLTATEHFLLGATYLGSVCKGFHLGPGHSTADQETLIVRAVDHLTQAAMESRHARALFHFHRAHALVHAFEVDPGRYADSLRQAANIITKLWPDSYVGCETAGDCLRHFDPEEAIRVYRRGTELEPTCFELWSNLGNVLQDVGRTDEAVAAHRMAVALQPTSAPVRYGLGKILKDSGRLEEAVRVLEDALDLHPQLAQAHTGIGQILAIQGRDEKAIESYRKALESEESPIPKSDFFVARTLGNMANACMRCDRTEEALACYQQAVIRKPNYISAYNNWAIACGKSRDMDSAIDLTLRSLDLDAENGWTCAILGEALSRSGRLEDAIAVLKRAVRMEPDNTRARAHLQEVVSLAPSDESDDPAAVQDAEDARIAALLRHHAEAASLYLRALQAEPTLAPRHRFAAAVAGALAGCDQNEKTRQLTDVERASWRWQALQWLREELQLARTQPRNPRRLATTLETWVYHPDLEGVRSTEAMKRLPPREREAWIAFWKEVSELLDEVG